MIAWLLPAALILAACAPQPDTVAVPTVGCPSDGQQGPRPAPAPRRPTVYLPAGDAANLAFYASEGLGVLAPRGWHCLEVSGSDASLLIVTPERHNIENARDIRGPAVQLGVYFGFTSGRFAVAEAIARLFPDHMAFARDVAAEGILDHALPSGPFPDDVLQRLSANAVRFTTPAGRNGQGTVSRLVPGADPIHGLVILIRAEEPDLLQLSIRMPRHQTELVPLIIEQARASLGSAVRPVD